MTFILFFLALFIHTEATQEIRRNVYFVESLWTSDYSAQPQELTLICNTSESQNGPVYWKKDLKWAGNGMALTITVRETPDAGNYTCWSNTTNELLSVATVYITKRDMNREIAEPILKRLETDPHQKTYLNCEANNYSGNFTCFWKVQSQNSELKFNIGAETENQSKSASGAVICENPQNNPKGTDPELYSASCRRENFCSSTEEYQRIEIALKVFNNFVYEKHPLRFFIKEILKPDISECEVTRSGILSWTPPQTWSTPTTYFGLTYQIQVIFNTHVRICEVDHSSLRHHGNSLKCMNHLCKHGECFIRSRDRYDTHSAWSNWSKCRLIDNHRNDKIHMSHQQDDSIHKNKRKIEKCTCRN